MSKSSSLTSIAAGSRKGGPLRWILTNAVALVAAGCAAGGEPAPDSAVGNEPASDSAAAAAPEKAAPRAGHELVYAAPAGDAYEVFSANLAGDDREQLTSLGVEISFPVWSPDGQRVLFVAGGGDSPDIMVLDIESGATSVVLAGNGNPADWGPGGDRVLVTKAGDNGRGLYIIEVATGTEAVVPTGSSADAYARWARNGTAIAYESARDGNPEIYLTNLETDETSRLTDNDILDEWPSLSRDGSWIAWASGTEEEKNLWVMRADGSDKRRVTQGLLFGDAFPEWSPDGRRILLTAREDDQFVLKLIDLDGGDVTDLGRGAGPSWR